MTNTQNTATPVEFVQAVEKYFNIHFIYDMAADATNNKAEIWCDEDTNALNIDWPRNDWCFLNPPFKTVGKWCQKCDIESKQGSKIITIWPLSSDINMVRAYKNANVYIIQGRIWGCVRGTMLCVWGEGFKEPVKGLHWDKKEKTLTRAW